MGIKLVLEMGINFLLAGMGICVSEVNLPKLKLRYMYIVLFFQKIFFIHSQRDLK